ncbi:penicillin acylase family protein [Chelatococcus sp. SYSU_G07232]|uniref:Penicillin acylase family protein n=1 Tax=Chelatococcus albus TaxID=3047466 RepID=A0ABT7AFN8_9HYPH|nr:penicillin acylase family protein [Chelatococcus sp. SYSU_G07232]MDJ1158190.1 penicillin acylase family protein [Chelatococcus sp. SYSU_G07232]
MQRPGTQAVRVEEIAVEGLAAAAEIVVDRWGIPHLRAEGLDDLFVVQGFNAARDRLWQIDLWRKRGLGLLAADFGPGYLAQDRAARLFLYRGDMAAEWVAYAPDAEAICTAFVAGINAYVALAEREPERLPPEFRRFGTRPARWAAADVVRIRSHGLTRNALSEIVRANVLSRADAATDRLRKVLEPAVSPRIAEGLDLAAIPLEAADVFKLATAPVTFDRARLAASLAEAWEWTKVNDLGEVVHRSAPAAPPAGTEELQGSNNWVVHGSRTASGRPILAGDPHRTHAVPSLRYLVHLTAPGFDAIGAGEPAVPGISMGHNGEIAFGLTIFGADQEDVYVYETKEDDALAYRYRGGFEAMTVVKERFAVKGAPDQVLALKFTRHGPVIHEDPASGQAIAVRSVWFEPGAAAYLTSISAMRARNLGEFRAAMRRWGAPSVNQIYADVRGTIAWMPAGYTPVRPNWDGLTPVPGDGRYEWAGMLDPDLLPMVVDPPEGFLATANEMNLGADWPHAERRVGYEWLENSRATRIRAVLGADAAHTVAASCALQTDTLSMPAARLKHILAGLGTQNADAARGLALLAAWDGSVEAGSAAAALFELWWTKHLVPALLVRVVADPAVRALIAPVDPAGVLEALEQPDGRFGAHPQEARDALLLETLAAAVRDAAAHLGGEAQWAWGALHHGYFEHAMSAVAEPAAGPVLDVGPLPKGGDGSTVMLAAYRPSDFRIVTGASVRFVVDVGDWDRSLCINTPGQSGDPRSPHYRDLALLWARGDYVPLLYSREAVERAAELRLLLSPARSGEAASDAPRATAQM